MNFVFVLLLSLILESLWAVSVFFVEKRNVVAIVILAMLMPLLGYINSIIVVYNHSFLLPAIIGHGIGGFLGITFITSVLSKKDDPKDQ